MADRNLVKRLASRHENFYLYDGNEICERIRLLKENFPSANILYSVKCNSDPNLLRLIFSQGVGADTSSLGETILASENGVSRNDIFYSAPGKTDSEIKQALPRSNIIADSLSEIERISKLAHSKVNVGVRINPNFSDDSDGGTLSKFGIDEDSLFREMKSLNSERIRICGIHVHLKSQILDCDQLVSYYSKMFDLAERIVSELGYELDYINMGSGIGIPYSQNDKELDMNTLGKEFSDLASRFKSAHTATRILIESGRFIVSKAGIYVTHVVDKKISRGKTFIILKNTMNSFIRPSLAHVICRYSPDVQPAPCEPLFTCFDEAEIIPLTDTSETETVTLCGDLCTAADTIADDVVMPKMKIGDTVMMTNAGAYAAVLTPFQFSSQRPPIQYTLMPTGELLHR